MINCRGDGQEGVIRPPFRHPGLKNGFLVFVGMIHIGSCPKKIMVKIIANKTQNPLCLAIYIVQEHSQSEVLRECL